MARNRMPYHKQEVLTCDPGETISMKLVDSFIDEHEKNIPRFRYLGEMYQGFYDLLHKPPKPDWKPDNRLAVNFPRYIVDTFLGYTYGIPIKKTAEDEAVQNKISEFDMANNIEDHEYRLSKLACIFGSGWEFFYQDENAMTRVSEYSPENCFCVYDDTARGKALFGVRYHYKTDSNERFGYFFTPDEICSFKGSRIIEREPNIFGRIPLVEYVLNDERIGLFEKAADLIELHSKVMSEKANDVDAFAEAYLSIIGAEVDADGVQRIRDDRVINFYGTDNAREVLVQFLTKPTADGTQENLLDRLERLIYETTMVANISDESFGNSSGTALAYKLQSMDNMARTFDRKMQYSMSKRYKLFCSVANNGISPDAWAGISYTMTRNVPKNLAEEAQIARDLEGIVSAETRLKVLSIVDDIPEEIERIEKENEIPSFTETAFGGDE